MNRETKREIEQMNLLMERMENRYTLNQVNMINERLNELDANDREEVDTADFFDMISSMKGGAKSTIGYVSVAKLNVPQVKRLNPATNRQKNFDDWQSFGNQLGIEGNIVGVIKFASYTLNWRSPESMTKHYNDDYKTPANTIRAKYGLDPISNRDSHTENLNFGSGVAVYKGDNVEKQGNSYSMQDTGGKGTKSSAEYYAVFDDGSIKLIDKEKLDPFFKTSSVDGVSALKKLNADDATIKAYSDEIAALNFRYMKFLHSSIVYVITSINGVKKRFFNKNLSSCLQGIDVDPSIFLSLAKKKYNVDDEQTQGEPEPNHNI